jgi:hypothetical protein
MGTVSTLETEADRKIEKLEASPRSKKSETRVISTQSMCISDSHIEHFKYIQFLSIKYLKLKEGLGMQLSATACA